MIGCKTENALLNFVLSVMEGLNESNKINNCFLNIKKSFDTVNYNILLNLMLNKRCSSQVDLPVTSLTESSASLVVYQ